MKRVVFLSLLVMLLTSRLTTAQTPTPTPAAAPTPSAVPPLINYQGMLTDADGKPLAGAKKLEFNLYDKPIDGTLIWGPQTFDNVYLGNGRFNVILGTTDAAGRGIVTAFNASNRYLSMKVGEPGADLAGVKELVPRQQLLSAPYAIQAEYALHGVPTGTIVAYYANTAPEGWLLCNGQTIPNESKYAKLRELVGGSTPNLQDRFIVGKGSRNLGQIGGEETHTLTIAEMPTHDHINGVFRFLLTVDGVCTVIQCDGNSTGLEPTLNRRGDILAQGGNQPHNNMPPYMTLNYIIKY